MGVPHCTVMNSLQQSEPCNQRWSRASYDGQLKGVDVARGDGRGVQDRRVHGETSLIDFLYLHYSTE